jgi:hypothetical protein
MRSTKDLIAELRAEAANADVVVLAVGFPNETKMIPATFTDAEALKELNGLLAQGGYPLGFVRITRQGDQRSVERRCLPEYQGDPVPDRALQQICQNLADGMERQYGVYARKTNGGRP